MPPMGQPRSVRNQGQLPDRDAIGVCDACGDVGEKRVYFKRTAKGWTYARGVKGTHYIDQETGDWVYVPVKRKGIRFEILCNPCYMQAYRTGSTERTAPENGRALEEKDAAWIRRQANRGQTAASIHRKLLERGHSISYSVVSRIIRGETY